MQNCCELYLSILSTGALLSSNNFTTTEDEIGQQVMIYLRNSADREGLRMRRMLAKEAAARQEEVEEEME